MAAVTKIAWTDSTWNPVRGCRHEDNGCVNCYAEALAARNHLVLGTWGPPPGGTRVVAAERYWDEPLRWHTAAQARGRPHRVFCASLADVFEDWPDPVLDPTGHTIRVCDWYPTSYPAGPHLMVGYKHVRQRIADVITATPALTWLLLTKRPQNISRMALGMWKGPIPAHVHLGTSVAGEMTTNKIDALLAVPGNNPRFLSLEPLVGPVVLRPEWLTHGCSQCGRRIPRGVRGCYHPLTGDDDCDGTPTGRVLDWVIVGGESGPRARPCHLEWIAAVVAQCRATGVPVFVKQLGQNAWLDDYAYERGEGKQDNPEHWPDELRVQQFPE